eukprot:2736669-Pleurochrysis_carterae.AAC.1
MEQTGDGGAKVARAFVDAWPPEQSRRASATLEEPACRSRFRDLAGHGPIASQRSNARCTYQVGRREVRPLGTYQVVRSAIHQSGAEQRARQAQENRYAGLLFSWGYICKPTRTDMYPQEAMHVHPTCCRIREPCIRSSLEGARQQQESHGARIDSASLR